MKNSNAEFRFSVARLVAMLYIFVATTDVHAAAPVRTRLLDKRELATIEAKIDAVTIPGRTGPLEIDKTQSFAVSGEGFPSFWIVPAHFEVVNQDGYIVPQPRCGLFLVSNMAQVKYTPYGWSSALRCNRLNGVGVVQNRAGTPPSILLLYATSASPDIAVREPVVLNWDLASKRYIYDENLSHRLEDDVQVTSVVTMKRRLKRYELRSSSSVP